MDALTWTARIAQCSGKEAFSTPQLASKVQRRRAKKRRTYKVQQQIYRCEACGLFHLGSKLKSRHAPTSSVRRKRGHNIEGDDSME